MARFRRLTIGVITVATFSGDLSLVSKTRVSADGPVRGTSAESVRTKVEARSANDRPPRSNGTHAGEVRYDNGIKIKLVWCPPGKFVMGSPKTEVGRLETRDHQSNEDQVTVSLTRGFWLWQFEVTQGQWERVMNSKPWEKKGGVEQKGADYPATFVGKDEIGKFLDRLTEAEASAGRLPAAWRYELPTEAQWEYACRAGARESTMYSFGNDRSQLSEFAWWGAHFRDGGNAAKEPFLHPVGSKKPNAWGLFDMHGNVEELCRDVYAADLPGGNDPVVTTGSDSFMLRGGSWTDPAENCRTANRTLCSPGVEAQSFIGFRVALCPAP